MTLCKVCAGWVPDLGFPPEDLCCRSCHDRHDAYVIADATGRGLDAVPQILAEIAQERTAREAVAAQALDAEHRLADPTWRAPKWLGFPY